MIEDRADLSNAHRARIRPTSTRRACVGPAIAGVVVAAVGEGHRFLIDGLSRHRRDCGPAGDEAGPDQRPPSGKHAWHELTEGGAYVTGSALIRTILVFLAAIGIVGAPYSVLTRR